MPTTESYTSQYQPRGVQTRPTAWSQKELKQLGDLPNNAGYRQDLTAPMETTSAYVKNQKGTDREQQIPYTSGRNAAMTGYQTYEDSGVNLRKRKDPLHWTTEQTVSGVASATARGALQDGTFILKGSARGAETPYIPGEKHINNLGASRAAEMQTTTLKEQTVCNTGGYSYLHAQTHQPKLRKSKSREVHNDIQHGSILGGIAPDLQHSGAIKKRRRKPNAFDTQPIGFAPYAIQRESKGRQSSKRKIRSENPRGGYDSLGLGLVCNEES